MKYLITIRYNNNLYSYPYISDSDMNIIEFLHTEGNQSCDCVRSQTLRRNGHPNFPDLSCNAEALTELISIVGM